MTEDKIYIKHIHKDLGISRTKLYELFKQSGLKTKKDGRRGYITPQQYSDLEKKTQSSDESGQFEQLEQSRLNKTKENNEVIKILVEQFEKEKAELKEELKQEREEKNKISFLLGQAQSEHEHSKKELLRLQEITQKPEEGMKKSWWKVWK